MNSHFLDRRYRILKVLKDGEKAKTYLVEDVNLSAKKFVVKRLYFSTNNTQNLTILHRLLASKVTTLEQLGQENDQIQKQVAYFEENEEFYLVQEFIPGNPLTDEILPGQPLREDQVISLLSEILEILIVVHSRGVIHQDIKPENIIRRDSDKKLVLVDFNSINEVSSNSHPLEYTPIEQVNGNLKYNSDIYALGIVAIAALLGLSTNEISHVRNQKYRFTNEIIWHNKNLKINKKLINIINKMVRFDYRKRYQYATEVLDDLKKLTSLEDNQQNRHSKKLLLVMTGIAGCLTLGIIGWFLQLQKSEDNPQQKLYQEGLNKYDAANYEGAIQDFSQLIKLEPKNALAYNKRGDAYYRLGDYEQAQTDSSQAILLNPQDANAYYDRGFALYELRKYKEAIADYTQAIKFNSQDAYAYYGRGLARVQIKDNKGALGDFTKAIAIKPEYREAYLQRGILRRRLKLRQAAMQDFDKIIKIDPSDARAFYQRGLTQVINKQKYAALKDYSDAININPKYIEAYLNRGDIYSDLGNKIEASEDYNTIIKLDPKFVPAYIHRGIHRFSFGDYKGAIQDYTEALKLDPNDAAAYNNRGNAYLELGNRKAANQDYSQAIAIDANNALAYYNRGVIRAKQKNKQGAIADFRKAAKLFQQQGEKDSYQDTQREIAILQNKSGTGNITRPKSSGREKKGSREN